jgi:hypothetical protein
MTKNAALMDRDWYEVVCAYLEALATNPVGSGDKYPFEAGQAFLFCFKLVDIADFGTPETGKSPTVTISKNSGAFGALTGAPAVSEISNGWYSVTVPAVDMVSGVVVLKAIATGTAQEDFVIYMA